MKSCEQIARDILDDLPDHRPLSSGEVVELANLVHATLYAVHQTHYGGSHGGLSETECQTVHDYLLKLCPRLKT